MTKKGERAQLQEQMLRYELAGVKPRQIMETMHLSESTYWRWRTEKEDEISAQFLQQKWRLVIQWWNRQQKVYSDLAQAYELSKAEAQKNKKLKPSYSLLLEMSRLENTLIDKLIDMGLAPSREAGAAMIESKEDLNAQLARMLVQINADKAKPARRVLG